MNNCTFDFSFFGLIDELLIVGDDALANGLSDCVDLSDVSSTSHSNSDVKIFESFQAEEQDGFLYFHSQCLGFEHVNWGSVDSHDTLTGSHGGNSDCIFLSAEALDELGLGLGHFVSGSQLISINILL